MASAHSTRSLPFLIFPTLSSQYSWKIISIETGRTISRHKNLELAVEKAEALNTRAFETQITECRAEACPIIGLHNTDECAYLIAEAEEEAWRA